MNPPTTESHAAPRGVASRVAGVVLALTGVAANKWVLQRLITADGSISGTTTMVAIVVGQLTLVALGLWLYRRAPRLRVPSRVEGILLGLSFVIAIGAAEGAARLAHLRLEPVPVYTGQVVAHNPNRFLLDSTTGWRMSPAVTFQWTIDGHENTYRANAQGFRRDDDFNPTASPLIGLVGDSFTWGTGVEYTDTFGYLLERELGGAVYNFAQPGFGVDQMWLSARHQILPVNPRLIIVAFIDDDFRRSLTALSSGGDLNKPRLIHESGAFRQQQPDEAPGSIWSFVQRHSVLWRAWYTVSPRRKAEWWDLNTSLIAAIADESKRQGVSVLVVRLPEKNVESFDRLTNFMRERGINYLNLEIPGRPRGIHFETDGHINAAGHRLVATEIMSWIRANQPALLGRPIR